MKIEQKTWQAVHQLLEQGGDAIKTEIARLEQLGSSAAKVRIAGFDSDMFFDTAHATDILRGQLIALSSLEAGMVKTAEGAELYTLRNPEAAGRSADDLREYIRAHFPKVLGAMRNEEVSAIALALLERHRRQEVERAAQGETHAAGPQEAPKA